MECGLSLSAIGAEGGAPAVQRRGNWFGVSSRGLAVPVAVGGGHRYKRLREISDHEPRTLVDERLEHFIREDLGAV